MVTLPGKCAAFMGMGPTELIVILIILLVLFGGSKLPGTTPCSSVRRS